MNQHLSARTRRLLDNQGFEPVPDRELAEAGVWLGFAFGVCAALTATGTAVASPLQARAPVGAPVPSIPSGRAGLVWQPHGGVNEVRTAVNAAVAGTRLRQPWPNTVVLKPPWSRRDHHPLRVRTLTQMREPPSGWSASCRRSAAARAPRARSSCVSAPGPIAPPRGCGTISPARLEG